MGDTMVVTMDTTLERGPLNLNLVMDMVIPLLTDTTDTMLWAKDPLNPVMVTPTLMAMLTVMVIPTLMDTTDTIIWARDPLNLATVILMLMVMVIVTMVIMDTPMAMASKFILLT